MTLAPLLLIVDSGLHEGGRGEHCDDCLKAVSLPKAAVTMLDDAEDIERPAIILCPHCAVRRYGSAFVMGVIANQRLEAVE